MEEAVEQFKIDHTRELDDLNRKKRVNEVEVNNAGNNGLQESTDDSDSQIV